MPHNVAIIDYGMGNLFSVKHACEHVGLHAEITTSVDFIKKAGAVILPGVGAFGDAMEALRQRNLIGPLKEFAASGKPFLGICLGLQLLMTESFEFGRHQGLGIIDGDVVRFDNPKESGTSLKVPHVGWNHIETTKAASWQDSLLNSIAPGEFMYFVHSYHVRPKQPEVILSGTRYGHIEFCSSLRYRNIFACQFHPERSGPEGLKVYRNFASLISTKGRT